MNRNLYQIPDTGKWRSRRLVRIGLERIRTHIPSLGVQLGKVIRLHGVEVFGSTELLFRRSQP